VRAARWHGDAQGALNIGNAVIEFRRRHGEMVE
jgi:hypothetical protein